MNADRREKRRTATLEEIRATAWKQIGEAGAGSLSLRGIAREMRVSATALYHYYEDRDALVTALLIEAFASFTTALETARDARPTEDHAGRFRALCKAYYTWAAQNPQRYALMFETPIPGYLFAQDLGPVAQRSFLVLQRALGEAHAAGKLTGEATLVKLPTPLWSKYDALRKMGMPYRPIITHLALAVWSMMHGITSLHLHHYLSGFLQDGVEAFIDYEIERMARSLGIV